MEEIIELSAADRERIAKELARPISSLFGLSGIEKPERAIEEIIAHPDTKLAFPKVNIIREADVIVYETTTTTTTETTTTTTEEIKAMPGLRTLDIKLRFK